MAVSEVNYFESGGGLSNSFDVIAQTTSSSQTYSASKDYPVAVVTAVRGSSSASFKYKGTTVSTWDTTKGESGTYLFQKFLYDVKTGDTFQLDGALILQVVGLY